MISIILFVYGVNPVRVLDKNLYVVGDTERREYLKDKINEQETNNRNKSIRDLHRHIN
jgi:hypothetical protein